MLRMKLFIDGSWLFHNLPRLAMAARMPGYRLDFRKLPRALAEEIGKHLGLEKGELGLAKPRLFGSCPVNVAAEDYDLVLRQKHFFKMLRERCGYEVRHFPLNFQGRRFHAHDRAPDDPFQPREKCVDVALAIGLSRYARPGHIAVVVGGDRDFLPALQEARRRGVRIALASIRGSCARALADPADPWRARDFQTIWLDDLVDRLALKRYRQQCCSEFHIGDRWVETPMRPYPGVPFYCSHCRARYAAWNDFPDAA